MAKSKSPYSVYENFANKIECHTQIAGRYSIQKEAEKRIVFDVIEKLNIQGSDNLLEIGCGTGNILIPLSFASKNVVGIDNKNAIDKLLDRTKVENLRGIVGNFLEIDTINIGKFEKILIYSVLHYLTNKDDLYSFIDKALNLLDENGMLLLGDIPNTSLKERFLESNSGKLFSKQWKQKIKNENEEAIFELCNTITFDDSSIFELMQHIKNQGYKVYLLPQPPNLPFGYTREDLIISSF